MRRRDWLRKPTEDGVDEPTACDDVDHGDPAPAGAGAGGAEPVGTVGVVEAEAQDVRAPSSGKRRAGSGPAQGGRARRGRPHQPLRGWGFRIPSDGGNSRTSASSVGQPAGPRACRTGLSLFRRATYRGVSTSNPAHSLLHVLGWRSWPGRRRSGAAVKRRGRVRWPCMGRSSTLTYEVEGKSGLGTAGPAQPAFDDEEVGPALAAAYGRGRMCGPHAHADDAPRVPARPRTSRIAAIGDLAGHRRGDHGRPGHQGQLHPQGQAARRAKAADLIGADAPAAGHAIGFLRSASPAPRGGTVDRSTPGCEALEHADRSRSAARRPVTLRRKRRERAHRHGILGDRMDQPGAGDRRPDASMGSCRPRASR